VRLNRTQLLFPQRRNHSERVVTFMKVDDYGARTGRLTAAIASVEAKVGKAGKK
jgi:hypothetical protein